MAYIPQEAVDVFEKSPHPRWEDAFNAGILTYTGEPCSERTAQRWFKSWRSGSGDDESEYTSAEKSVTQQESETEIKVSYKDRKIHTLEELLDVCQVDLSLWEVDRWRVKPFQAMRKKIIKDLKYKGGKATGHILDEGGATVVQMYSVEAWFKRKETAPFESALESLIEKIKTVRETTPVIQPHHPTGRFVFLPAFFDTHSGRLILNEDNSPARTSREMKAALRAMLGRVASMRVDLYRILYIIGNDAFHVDNLNNTTTRGTWQEMSANQRTVIEEVINCNIEMIDMMLTYAPVDVVACPGNHDRLNAFWLGQTIKAYYHNNPDVDVTVQHTPRTYKRYGVNLIGMEHGDRAKIQKLPLLMAEEAIQDWSQTKYHVWLRGHFHVQQDVLVHIDDGVGSVMISTFPAFCPQDEWEQLMGFFGGHRAAEGRLYHLDHGPSGRFPIFVDELDVA